MSKVALDFVKIDGEDFLKISSNDLMRPFFMSIVSNSNHWMFISSNGGLSAGRKDAEHALFPYYTDDKITEAAEITGSKSIFWIESKGEHFLWEPFSDRFEGRYQISRNLYKNILGNKVLFEEINHDLNLTFRYQWNSSDRFGFIKKSSLQNHSGGSVNVAALDGIQNIIPYGVGSFLQNQSSNLVDAYKRNQLEIDAGLGIYALSAIIVDKAEPSEALKANISWSLGIEKPTYLMSSRQLPNFRKRIPLTNEIDVKAEKGAYFINFDINLKENASKEWMLITDVNKNLSAVAKVIHEIKNEQDLITKINQDIELGSQSLIELNAGSDALQLTQDKYRDTRHFSNTLFNIMRGGIFDDNYQIEKWDFLNYLEKANKNIYQKHLEQLQSLPDILKHSDLNSLGSGHDNYDLERLCIEYMPLKFSRRHGDPSRPWNKFSINTQDEVDGSKILDYEGNWRDIFQNWEALAYAYPDFIESMIHKFLNATTFDGYNPYRVTKGGFDWESIELDDPWSYIGYWGDHQIIYLLKLLEISQNHHPGRLKEYFNKDMFVYANVPYKIKPYEEIVKNPKDTIDFDFELDHNIRAKRDNLGADGALLTDKSDAIHHVNFIEKLLATLLSKFSNFIPEGGIWMNTQRPEWNDANNALVGNGVSMVTLYYMSRFLKFFETLIQSKKSTEASVSAELLTFFNNISTTFEKYHSLLKGKINDNDRKLILDDLGSAASKFRLNIYNNSFSGERGSISTAKLRDFVKMGLEYIEHSIKENKRRDNLYHAYNLMSISENDGVQISHLDEMLEGQVAVLSSGSLSSEEALSVFDALKSSKLFREDQYSYILYPFKNLPKFMEKNVIPQNSVDGSKFLSSLVKSGNSEIIERDVNGLYHFNGNFKNAQDLKHALNQLSGSTNKDFQQQEKDHVLKIFEEIFNHKSFTGRSGTFYGYEGLGSIYWHMVSKLQLAAFECCVKAIQDGESEVIIGRLIEHYYEINEGVGVHKSPELYGAFPTDPYSHTPAGKGAQQPGMTGQVKEDILSRFGELGIFVNRGEIRIDPCLLRRSEFLQKEDDFNYINLSSEKKQIHLEAGSLAFTYCQVPIVYKISNENKLNIKKKDGSWINSSELNLNEQLSKEVFGRTGEVVQMIVEIQESYLRK